MSLNHLEAIPVDTHVFQIATKHYLPAIKVSKAKTVTSKIYSEIGDHFREVYGPLAGWAQTVMVNFVKNKNFIYASIFAGFILCKLNKVSRKRSRGPFNKKTQSY